MLVRSFHARMVMLSHIWLFATPWILVHQAPPSMGLPRQESLEWVAISSSRGSSWPKDRIQVSCISYIGRWIIYHWVPWGIPKILSYSVQFSRSIVSDSLRLMKRSTPGLLIHHQLLEFTQTYVHRVSDAIQPFHLLSFPSPPAPNPSQHQGLFQLVNTSHEMAKVLEFQLQRQSFWWTPRTDLL